MNRTEHMILSAIANGAKVADYKHFNHELHNLHNQGYIHCIFDEQDQVINGNITPFGKRFITENGFN